MYVSTRACTRRHMVFVTLHVCMYLFCACMRVCTQTQFLYALLYEQTGTDCYWPCIYDIIMYTGVNIRICSGSDSWQLYVYVRT
jgi:hypothetical protein